MILFKLIWNIILTVIIGCLFVVWWGFIFGSVLGVILILIFAPGLFLFPLVLTEYYAGLD